jgi:hypothetical protein
LIVAGIEAHGGGELVAGGGGLAYFQQCVGQVFADGVAIRRKVDGELEAGNGTVLLLGL